ncbi:nitroreductase/quinone reductase family protein [Nocardia sp. NBC_00565]|uniref:nitroreductase/quinone reductase family protein n=1 Tax=Nocardia sp. NBC_00565 TaxID=2975993 RepID=UPI002E81C32B|nr:nitroreductase/quinone reductase family protein [Nocardia sp. NBC_00565]WUC00053.1 nitroreductase/quinone reductase family protein [Nocardia sp. NBC_00565]
MAKQYHVGALVRISNRITAWLVRVGVPIGTFAVLGVRGRKSGRTIETPLAVFGFDGKRYLVASYGVVNWVRNLRAAHGAATLRRGRRVESIRAAELPIDAAAPVLRSAVRAGPPGIPRPIVRLYRRFFVLPYLDLEVDAPLADFDRAARTHPVFLVETDVLPR